MQVSFNHHTSLLSSFVWLPAERDTVQAQSVLLIALMHFSLGVAVSESELFYWDLYFIFGRVSSMSTAMEYHT